MRRATEVVGLESSSETTTCHQCFKPAQVYEWREPSFIKKWSRCMPCTGNFGFAHYDFLDFKRFS